MNRARLALLAATLETIPEETFDMSTWGRLNPFGQRLKGEDEVDIHTCGTAACALGYATGIPEFKTAGLKLIKYTDESNKSYPAFNQFRGVSAGREFFGITHNTATQLFLPEGYNTFGKVTPRMVAAKIYDLLIHGEQ